MSEAILCHTCQLAAAGFSDVYEVSNRGYSESDVYLHHRTYESFYGAKRLGCIICNLIWFKLHEIDNSRTSPLRLPAECFWTYTFDIGYHQELTRWSFRVMDKNGRWIYDFRTISLNTFKDEEVERAEKWLFQPERVHTFAPLEHQELLHKMDHEIRPCTDSISCINLVQNWLSDCRKSHAECNLIPPSLHLIPGRVVDVGKLGESDVRLHVCEKNEYEPYLTLSHCWGGANFLKLTTENEASLKNGFAVRDLPKTFRQAIQFTRAISVKYLWIDSLCIQQDSANDWRHQSALMGDIYSNCLCNIAATKSIDSDGGIFFERDPNLVKPVKLAIKWTSRYERTIIHGQGVYYVYLDELWADHVESAPLNTRGWVIQERLLSPRIIHFGERLFWECNAIAACEIAPTGKPYLGGYGYNGFYRDLRSALMQLSLGSFQPLEGQHEPKKMAYAEWWKLIEKYSDCKLSKDDDILVAVSGIAKIMSQALGDKYLAGLWRSRFLLDLLWSSHFPRGFIYPPELDRASPYRAPSWSWASIKGPIWPGNHQSIHANDFGLSDIKVDVVELLQVIINAKGEDMTGQVTGGNFSVRCRTFYATWDQREYHDNNLEINVMDNVFKGGVYLDERRTWERLVSSKDNSLLCMPIFLEGRCASNTYMSCDGLVLEPTGLRKGDYVRIGLFGASCKAPTMVDFLAYTEVYNEGREETVIVY